MREDPPAVTAASEQPSIIKKILSFFMGGGDPQNEKKKLLKLVQRDLSKSRFKFYRVKTEEVLPGLGKFFYDVYKVTSGAQILLGNAEQSTILRSYIMDNFLEKRQFELAERLTEDAIRDMIKTMQPQDATKRVKEDLINYFAAFDAQKVRAIDGAWSELLAFLNFCNFDYYFVLKKFDSALSERNFNYHPKFESIRSEYICDDIKDFLEVLLALDLDYDWKWLFEMLRGYKGVDIVPVDAWQKLLPVLREVRDSAVLASIVRAIESDPFYQPAPRTVSERIVETQLQKVKTQTEVTIQKIAQERRTSKIDELSKIIFGTTAISRTKNYTDKNNAVFTKKMVGGFIHVQAVNYLKAFLLDFYKKDIRELVDLLLIRGKWTTNIMSQQLSESFHDLMTLSDELLKFDDSIAEDGELGTKLKAAMLKSDRNKEEIKYVRQILKDINDKAQSIVNMSAQNLIVLGKSLKSLIDDNAKAPHEVLINWKEIELSQGGGDALKQRMVSTYKRIFFFIQLLQFFVRSDPVAS